MKRFLENIDWKLVSMWVLMGVFLKIFNDQLTASHLPTNVIFILGIGLQISFYWVVLRKYIQRMSLWILASIAGMLVVWIYSNYLGIFFDQIYNRVNPFLAAFLVFPLYNASLMLIRSIIQWIVLRKEVQAAHFWVIGSVMATIVRDVLSAYLLVAWLPDKAVKVRVFYDPYGEGFVEIVFLIITGMVMAYLLPSIKSTHNQRLELETL